MESALRRCGASGLAPGGAAPARAGGQQIQRFDADRERDPDLYRMETGRGKGARFRRAWIQRRTKPKDWAGTGRYLNVAICEGGSCGRLGPDFPIFNNLPDKQILQEFVQSFCRINRMEAIGAGLINA